MWLEIVSRQNALVFKTVSEITGMANSAPSDALANWAKQSAESFIEAQKQWSSMAIEQGDQLMKAMRSGANLSDPNVLSTVQETAGNGLQTLIKMRMSWLDFAAQQNAQMMKMMKEGLKLDDSSPANAIADFAQATMTSYVEIQKRWMDVAMQLPLFGSPSDKK